MITERITPAPHLVGVRRFPIRMVVLHATRGGSANHRTEYVATKNWFQSPNNHAPGETWGGCASAIIGGDGEMCIVLDDNQIPRYSCGYGGIGPPTEYLVDDYAKSYEIAQPRNGFPYTDAQYERTSFEVAKDCRKWGIAPVMLDLRPAQLFPVPTGITRHDRTANGMKLGKTDPGVPWDDALFIMLLKAELAGDGGGEEPDLTPEENKWLKEIRDRTRIQAGPGDNASAKEVNARDLFGAGWIVKESGSDAQWLIRAVHVVGQGPRIDAYHIPDELTVLALTSASGGHYLRSAPAGWIQANTRNKGTLPAALGQLGPEPTDPVPTSPP